MGWMRSLSCVFMSLCIGCAGGARFGVRVWGPEGQLLPNVRVSTTRRLPYACGGQVFHSQKTNHEGLAKLATEWCSDQVLVVSAPGMHTHREPIDTCKVKFVQVSLTRAPPARGPRTDCERAAVHFIEVAQQHVETEIEALMFEPAYTADFASPFYGKALWGIDVEESSDGEFCRVIVGLFSDWGCSERWLITLHKPSLQLYLVESLADRPI